MAAAVGSQTVGFAPENDGVALMPTLDGYLRTLEKTNFTGSVLIAKGGRILFNKGYGRAQENSAFHIASVSKQFTAAAIMKLYEMDKVDLHQCINEYLPVDLQSEGKWSGVTVHQLLTHTSGMSNCTERADYEASCSERSVEDVLQEVREEQLGPPKFSYSNTGYYLLGKIIEKQSRLSYAEFVKQALLIPAGMDASTVQESERGHAHVKAPNEVSGHVLDPSGMALVEKPLSDAHLLFSAGGLISTAQDLAKWSCALDCETVLSQKSIQLMKTAHVKTDEMADECSFYGYGLFVNGDQVFHPGSVMGFSSMFYKCPKKDLFIAVLSNSDELSTEYVQQQLERIIDGQTPPSFIPFPNPKNPDIVDPYLKSFEVEIGGQMRPFTFSLDDSCQLMLHREGTPPSPCLLLSSGNVFCPALGAEFEKQKDGKSFLIRTGSSTFIMTPKAG